MIQYYFFKKGSHAFKSVRCEQLQNSRHIFAISADLAFNFEKTHMQLGIMAWIIHMN